MSVWKDAPAGDKTLPVDREGTSAGVLCLVVIDDELGGVHPLPARGRVTVGRGTVCDVYLPSPTISRMHAAIECGSPLRVRDLESANGIVVRGRRLAPGEAVEIAHGDVIEFGSVVAVLQYRAAPTTSEPRTPAIQNSRPTHLPPPPRSTSVSSTLLGALVGKQSDAAIVRDPAMRRLFDLIQRVAPSDLSVLILGETGAGKEIVAESVHRASPRASGPFARLNCAALSPTLLESELFGHEKGAFTGAVGARPGLLESATGGTVFLDEAGEMPRAVQVKLLRVLEERLVLRVGGLKPRALDVRFVAATNRDLKAEIARGTFRQDLYYRLNGITVEVPPLRARVTEIEPLARHFADRAAARATRTAPAIGPAALAALRAYDWPGNVRELRNAIERAVLLAGDETIVPAHLPDEIVAGSRLPVAITSASPALDIDATNQLRSGVGAFERERIIEALAQCAGNQTRAAELLGVSRRTLVTKLKLYDIPRR